MADDTGDGGAKNESIWTDRHLWDFQPLRDVGVIAAGVGIVYLGYALRVITVPLLLALALAYLLEPVVRAMHSRGRLNRPSAAVTLIIAMAVVVIGPLVVGGAFAVVQGVQLAGQLPEYLRGLGETVLPAIGVGPEEMDRWIERGQAWVEANFSALAQGAARRGVGVVGYVTGVVGSLVQVALLLFLVPFFFYFFSTAYPRVLDFGRRLTPAANRDRWLHLIGRMDKVVSGFVRGRLVIAFVLGIFHAVGWLIAGVPAAVLLGIIAGVLSIIPFAIVVVWPVAVGLLWLEQSQAAEPMALWAILLWPSLVYFLGQALEGYILTPLIQGKTTNLDAATIVAAVLAGTSVAGAYGALLAIPVAACIKIVIAEVIWPHTQDWLEGRTEDPLPIGKGKRRAPKG